MGFIKCSDIVRMSIDEETSRLYPQYRVNRTYMNTLFEYCDEFDKLGNEFFTKKITAYVDEDRIIHIIFDFEEIVVQEEETYSLYGLIERSVGVKFRYGDNETIIAEFMFPSIWE